PMIGRIFDAAGNEILGKTLTIGPDGKYQFDELPTGTYTLLFQIKAPNGELLAGIKKTVTIGQNGEIILEPGLIDPFGIVTNSFTNESVEDVVVTLYWADTELNEQKGRVKDTAVPLPVLEDFAPNQNENPQSTTAAGEYAWMVFADGDYYLLGTKDGYITFDSRLDDREVDLDDSWIRDGIIHVGQTIVEYDFLIDPILTAPDAPIQLRAEEVTETGTVLVWNPVNGPGTVTYNVYRDGVLVAQNVTEPTYEDTGLVGGKTYAYEVTAENFAGESPKSNTVEVSIQTLEEINEDIKDALKKLKVQYAPGDIWESITLPLFLVRDGANQTVVGWTSNRTDVISIALEPVYDGDDQVMEFVASVNRQPTDTSVILTATVSKGSGTPLSRTFLLIVKSTVVEQEKETNKRDNSTVKIGDEDIPVTINRTTLSNGNKIDKLILSSEAMDNVIASNNGNNDVKLSFSDTPSGNAADRADELAFEIPIGAIEKLDAQKSLQIATPEGSVKLNPALISAVKDLGTDLFFRIVPIRDGTKKSEVADDVKENAGVKLAVGTNQMEVLDIPRTIETNYTGLATDVILPLRDLDLPADPTERQRYLGSLRVFIQHTDGTTRVAGGNGPDDVPATIVYENGAPVGISFTIPKFSTFTMFRVIANQPSFVLPSIPVHAISAEIKPQEAEIIEVTLDNTPGYYDPEAIAITVGGVPAKVTKVESNGKLLTIHTDRPIPFGYQVTIVYDAGAAERQNQWNALSSFELTLENAGMHTKYINGYPDREFKPENQITRAEVAVILTRLLNRGSEKRAAGSYPDVEDSHWAASSIEIMRITGIMEGYDDGLFKPDAPITRGEFAAVILRFIGKSGTKKYTQYAFPDIADHWAQDLIQALHEAEIMFGEDGKFYPNRNLSRAEAVTAINRAIGRGELEGDFEPSWPDVPESHWAYGHVEEASRTHEYTRVSEAMEQWLGFLD
ncbi:MAG TPA: S-layer homology domain-containing protein, partial [Paenibacillus sp.]|nr:S-layer homology domain-containing protein [Paenibacillus sp.]